MNELQIFDNNEFGKIRTLEQDGKILFCGKDVAKVLGYTDVSKAIKQHCQKDGWAFYPLIDKVGREQQARFIDEGNLYRLIAHSKLPSAEKFERWVFDEVLPTIRKTGSYGTPTITNENIGMIGAIVAEVFKQVIPAMGEMVSAIVREEMGTKRSREVQGTTLSTLPPIADLSYKPMRRTIGKVDCLPSYLRVEVNRMLDEGKTYKEIVQFLKDNGEEMSQNAISSYNRKLKKLEVEKMRLQATNVFNNVYLK